MSAAAWVLAGACNDSTPRSGDALSAAEAGGVELDATDALDSTPAGGVEVRDAPMRDDDPLAPEAAGAAAIRRACEAACATRADPVLGGCPVADDQSCPDWCVAAGLAADAELVDALLRCVESDPLCFQTPLQCALSVAFPDPIPHTVRLRGQGFAVADGTAVVAGIETGSGLVRGEGVARAGRFAVELPVAMHVASPHLVLYYVDETADGSCTRGQDVAGASSIDIWMLPRGEIRVPDWTISAEPQLDRDSSWVCDTL